MDGNKGGRGVVGNKGGRGVVGNEDNTTVGQSKVNAVEIRNNSKGNGGLFLTPLAHSLAR